MFPPQPPAAPVPMAPTPPPSVVPQQIPLSEEKLAIFRTQIERSLAVRKQHEPWWDANLRAYAPKPGDSVTRYAQDINTNRDFTLVERKKADLFFQRPEVSLQPTPLMDGPVLVNGQPLPGPPDAQGQPTQVQNAPSLQAHKEIVNELLGPDGIDAKRMVHECLFDEICTSGDCWTKLGYEQHSIIQTQVDPLSGLEREIPVPVKRTVYWHYFSPKQSLRPHTFRSTEWDRAPWLGMSFTLPLTKANKEKYHLPKDFTGSRKSSPTDQHFDYGLSNADGEQTFTGVELEYRSILFRDDITHPDHLTLLVLVDGMDTPAIHQDSPHQTIDAKGALTPDSLIGFSIHPGNLRMQTDTAYVASDCTMIRPLVAELNTYRGQSVDFRDATLTKWMYNADTLPPDALAKIVRSKIGGMIAVPNEAFLGEGCIKELPQGSIPRDNWSGQQAIDDDIARTTGIDANGAGVQTSGGQTATEAQIQQGNANARLKFERGVKLDWYIKGVNKFSTLVQRYLPVEDAATIVGTVRAQAWDVWRKTVPSALAFTALPDSALMTDQAADRKDAQELYSFLANDPYANRKYLLTKLAPKFHMDPAQLVRDPDPPKPEMPKLSLSFKGEDLVAPQAPIVIELLTQLGMKISPEAIQQATGLQLAAQQQAEAQALQEQMLRQQPHGGKVAQQESLSKHATEHTGALQGIGGPASSTGPGGVM